MKRLVSLLMVFAMMMISTAWAEEFTIHSGVKFGMSVDEVIAAEKANGFSAKLNDNGEVSFEGQVAGYKETNVYYQFVNQYLVSARYQFNANRTKDDIFKVVQRTLTEKYGEPIAEDGYLDFEIEGETVLDFYAECASYGSCDVKAFSQWVYPISSGYVNIMLIDFKWLGKIPAVVASYSYLTEENYTSFYNEKAEEMDQKNSSLNNDL